MEINIINIYAYRKTKINKNNYQIKKIDIFSK